MSITKDGPIDFEVINDLYEATKTVAEILSEEAAATGEPDKRKLLRRAGLYRREAAKVLKEKPTAIDRAFYRHEPLLNALSDASNSGKPVERPFKYAPHRVSSLTWG